MGVAIRRLRNMSKRANGIEPKPGLHAGVKRRRRYLKRRKPIITSVRNPERYLNPTQRRLRAAA